jgi:hypothetical protein
MLGLLVHQLWYQGSQARHSMGVLHVN